jgi:hypothetical protein
VVSLLPTRAFSLVSGGVVLGAYFAETMTAIAEGLEEPSAVARDGQRGMPIVMDT